MELLKNLFEILEKSENHYKIQLASKEHPIFKAHFPNNELLPGFIQIDIIANVLNHKVSTIVKAKFLSVIKPNDIINYYVSNQNQSKYKIIIKNENNNKKISEIIYESK
ncbi:3-hydroxyacyl-ACP dehydratase [Malaciobacter marinus]|uniref:3-hydroxyacyl-ACP dehydratase n=1 Tax=Malaciobacter marinus TaxID=505249 RepID=UPI003B00D3AC